LFKNKKNGFLTTDDYTSLYFQYPLLALIVYKDIPKKYCTLF